MSWLVEGVEGSDKCPPHACLDHEPPVGHCLRVLLKLQDRPCPSEILLTAVSD